MELRYQRDLYRVQACCDTEKEEDEIGYPLQMCLRNSIPGLLDCHGQRADGKFSICWDITSRYSVAQIVGEGSITVELLVQILEALRRVMAHMDKYLIPCEHLVLEPACIYLSAEAQDVRFLCDFEQSSSFRTTLLAFGEFVLAHMDHRDQGAMHLGYGLYRLAVEETFDREAFVRLLQKPEPAQAVYQGLPYREGEARVLSETDVFQGDKDMSRTAAPKEETDEQRLRREALASFFAEEEKDNPAFFPPKKMVLLCGIAVILGMLLMELVVYFRNGCHLSPGWLLTGAVVLVLSLSALTVMEVCCRKKGRLAEETAQKKRKASDHHKDSEKNNEEDKKNNVFCRGYREMNSHLQNLNLQPAGTENPAPQMAPEATVVLSARKPSWEEEVAVLICGDGREYALKGEHWLIGKHRGETDICLDRPTVSRLHARIYRKNADYYIEDLNSRNGTWLGEKLLSTGQPELLKDGDEIVFADMSCKFRSLSSKKHVIYGD